MPDLSIFEDPFSTEFERSRPIRTVVFSDGIPTDFIETPTKPSSSDFMDRLIAEVGEWGASCPGFFGDRRPAWERGK